ncbi:LysE family translocator [Variovorax sp. J22P271]|uniref:LysE family translocator n=1 Tax=Variovorax davisae TaxID=3053515 RepID=UPI002575E4E6|nr:LysE family translocator [Variovorax sp. J22P271]MDM0036942.1 LysE family translocator [Variovorax sp. J22P271]
MTLEVLSMAAFALAASISPGPVNVLVLAVAVREGFLGGMRVVAGATVGFAALLVLAGVGLQTVLARFPGLISLVTMAGVGFLLYMAWTLWRADGSIGSDTGGRSSFWSGASMQWMNAKAWLAAIAGTGAFANDGAAHSLLVFCAIYFLVCFVSMAAWSAAGASLREALKNETRVRLLNRSLSVLLLISAAFMFRTCPWFDRSC